MPGIAAFAEVNGAPPDQQINFLDLVFEKFFPHQSALHAPDRMKNGRMIPLSGHTRYRSNGFACTLQNKQRDLSCRTTRFPRQGYQLRQRDLVVSCDKNLDGLDLDGPADNGASLRSSWRPIAPRSTIWSITQPPYISSPQPSAETR